MQLQTHEYFLALSHMKKFFKFLFTFRGRKCLFHSNDVLFTPEILSEIILIDYDVAL